MGQGNPKLVSWAAQDGRLQDLIYHLQLCGPRGLLPAPGSEKRRSPLHLAAIGGHLECISVLYDAGAKLNARDSDGMTALHLAASNGHFYVAQLLLDLGADENKTTRFGIAPIHLATSCGHTPIIKVLAGHGADINKQESWGQTPLMIATQQYRVHCMRLFLEMGADKTRVDHLHGNTALHIACAAKDEETLLVLLDGGCDLRVVNNAGLSPLGVAIESKFYRAVPLLLEYGAIPNVTDFTRCSDGLRSYIEISLGNPRSLSSQARVIVRQSLSHHANLRQPLEMLNLPPDDQTFVCSVRDDCCSSNEVKRCALLGRTVVTGATNTVKSAITKF